MAANATAFKPPDSKRRWYRLQDTLDVVQKRIGRRKSRVPCHHIEAPVNDYCFVEKRCQIKYSTKPLGSHLNSLNNPAPPPTNIYLRGLSLSTPFTTVFANTALGIALGPWLEWMRRMMSGRYSAKSEPGAREKRAWPFMAMFERTEAGATCTMAMPSGLSSMESTSLMLRTAALVAQYMPFHGVALSMGGRGSQSM